MLTVEPSKRSNYFYGFTCRFQIRRLILYVIKRLIRANNTFKRYKFLQFTRICKPLLQVGLSMGVRLRLNIMLDPSFYVITTFRVCLDLKHDADLS